MFPAFHTPLWSVSLKPPVYRWHELTQNAYLPEFFALLNTAILKEPLPFSTLMQTGWGLPLFYQMYQIQEGLFPRENLFNAGPGQEEAAHGKEETIGVPSHNEKHLQMGGEVDEVQDTADVETAAGASFSANGELARAGASERTAEKHLSIFDLDEAATTFAILGEEYKIPGEEAGPQQHSQGPSNESLLETVVQCVDNVDPAQQLVADQDAAVEVEQNPICLARRAVRDGDPSLPRDSMPRQWIHVDTARGHFRALRKEQAEEQISSEDVENNGDTIPQTAPSSPKPSTRRRDNYYKNFRANFPDWPRAFFEHPGYLRLLSEKPLAEEGLAIAQDILDATDGAPTVEDPVEFLHQFDLRELSNAEMSGSGRWQIVMVNLKHTKICVA